MLLFILFALILAKFKNHRILCIFKTIDLYPLFAVELIYTFFQLNVFLDNYSYVQYASQIQTAFMLVLLLPILRRRLYPQALIGSGFVVAGSILNLIVISANDGKMPVFPTISRFTHFYRNDALSQGIDSLHILMTDTTKLNFLADYIDTGFSIMSIGDVLIHSFVAIVVFYTVKRINQEIGKCK